MSKLYDYDLFLIHKDLQNKGVRNFSPDIIPLPVDLPGLDAPSLLCLLSVLSERNPLRPAFLPQFQDALSHWKQAEVLREINLTADASDEDILEFLYKEREKK